jgi:hypothetical protein
VDPEGITKGSEFIFWTWIVYKILGDSGFLLGYAFSEEVELFALVDGAAKD